MLYKIYKINYCDVMLYKNTGTNKKLNINLKTYFTK